MLSRQSCADRGSRKVPLCTYAALCTYFALCTLHLPLLLAASQAPQVTDAAVYLVAYVEVMPSSTSEAVTLLRQYAKTSRGDAGHVRLETLQQRGRPDHFAVLEVWSDQKALDAHQAAAHSKQFREKLQRLQVSPYDERPHKGFDLGMVSNAAAAGALYVVTHADAVPTGKDDAAGYLKGLAEASRKESSNVRFEILQQNSRLNHFTVVEVWKEQKAHDAHVVGAHTRQFRDNFQRTSGALYDERLYTAIN
jgi:quinol monooxygenase YgiN